MIAQVVQAAHEAGADLLGCHWTEVSYGANMTTLAFLLSDALARDIRAAGGPEVAAYDLGSINQNFAESLAVVQSAPDTPAWLLVGVNLGR
ncbi:MAG: hypothetical protein CVU47_06850, partial [Chloroflexi bacterium HGW-Chloroflexi-9]